jgi:hypothetical protein
MHANTAAGLIGQSYLCFDTTGLHVEAALTMASVTA